MTRVNHARRPYAPQRSGALDQPRAALKKKKPYKILLEAVTQEKKRLHSILTYTSNAPSGFGFIPAGHPEFTEWCKEQCRQRNLDVHIVSAKPKSRMHCDPEKLSHHVHRVGHHFPLEIITLACSKFGYTYDQRHSLRKAKDGDRTNWIAQRFEDYSARQVLDGRPPAEKESKEHIHGAVREMFPKIPEADLQAIVTHAFQKGTRRVGNAKELSLPRRVQLAVVAHIRHTYTDYDKLLKTGGWAEARAKVEHVSLAKILEWRDESSEQSNELEETFREVIVLDDDDDEGTSDEASMSTPDEREQSMEVVFSRATPRDLQPERHVDYPGVDVRHMRRAPRETVVASPFPPPPRPYNLAGASRAQPLLRQPPQPSRDLAPQPEPRPVYRGDAFHMAHSRPNDPRSRPADPGPRPGPDPRSSQPIMREINGHLYQLRPIEEPRPNERLQYDYPPHPTPRRLQEGYVQSFSPRLNSLDKQPANARRPSDQDVVLPSVEREIIDLTSPRRVDTLSRPYDEIQSPKRKASPSFADDRETRSEQYTKHLRPVHREEVQSRIHQHNPFEFPSNQSMDAHSRPRALPPQQFADLIPSPRHPPTRGGVVHYVPAHSLPGPNGQAYAPAPSRRSPMREARGAYYQVPGGEPSGAYISDTRMYERRASPARDYIPLREERQPPRAEEAHPRYMRNGARYDG